MLMFINNIKEEVELIEEFMKEKSINMHQILDFKCFRQLWPSTSLGFDGWGGSSMTYAVTTVIEELYSIDGKMSSRFHVFFGGRYAYSVSKPNDEFKDDLKNQIMEDVSNAKDKYNTFKL